MYARNSSYSFTLLQNIINYIESIRKSSSKIDKLLLLPEKTIYNQIRLQSLQNIQNLLSSVVDMDEEKYVINVKKLAFMSNYSKDEIIFCHSDKVILYGESGVGKSTFLNIMKGLWEPDVIEIELNDKLVKYHFHQLEENIMLIRYDTFKFFNESLREFITEDFEYNPVLLNYLIGITEMEEICGDLTKIINNQNISSGQVRRLILIKAFYHFYMGKYSILLLDELDNGIHQDLFSRILSDLFNSRYFKNKLIILISHNKMLHHNEDLFNKRIEISKNIIRMF